MMPPEDTGQDHDGDVGAEAEAATQSMDNKEDLGHPFEEVLKDLPEVLKYIKRLNEHIKKQQYTLVRLYEKLKEYKQSSGLNLTSKNELKDVGTQTEAAPEELASLNSVASPVSESNAEDHCTEWTAATGAESGLSIADEVKKVAESAMQQTGFVYEETSGMYYDYNTGFYYNAEMGLYYDGNSGTYMYYNEGTKTYEYHSQAALPAMVATIGQAALPAPVISSGQVGLPDIPGVSSPERTTVVQIEKFPKSSKGALAAPEKVADVKVKTVKSVVVVPDKAADAHFKLSKPTLAVLDTVADTRGKLSKSALSPSDKAADVRVKSSKSATAQSNKLTEVRKKSSKSTVTVDSAESRSKSSKTTVTDNAMELPVKPSRLSLSVPDPLETKEDDFHIPGSNPMAPVLLESSKESKDEQKTSRESRHEHKRKGKHKKHKSKKKKKKRHRSHSRGENSMEEGECSESSESQVEKETDYLVKMSAEETEEEKIATEEVPPSIESNLDLPITQPWKKIRRLSDEANEAWPPCMRIIVQSTEVKNLSVGTLFIVTCKGGTLGREKFHAVSIPDINISKHHGIFNFDEANGGHYFLTDYGSRNGTYVNKLRLSAAKQESEPCEISHGTIITLGSTDLLCHIHPGRETCEECEPGVVAAKRAEDYEQPLPASSSIAGESKAERRLQEMRRLRKRFGLEGGQGDAKADLLAPGYEDRAEIRRVTVGSHNEHAKTEMASATESIRSTNKGFKMLSKMGWKEGEALGKDGTGLTEPVLVSQRAQKAGLGADNAFSASAAAPWPRQRADRWQLARQRYGQLADTVDASGPGPELQMDVDDDE